MNATATTKGDPATDTAFPTLRKVARSLNRRARVVRRIFLSRTSLKIYLTGAGLICLTYNGLRWYGRRALRAEQDRVASIGMARAWKDLESPMPPESENFFEAPVFAGIFAPPYPEAPQLCLWLGWRLPEQKRREGAVFFDEWSGDSTLAAWCAHFRNLGTLPEKPTQDSPAGELLGDERFVPVIQAVYAAASRPEARWPSPGGAPRVSFHRMARGIQLYARAALETGNVNLALPAFRVIRQLTTACAAGGRGLNSLTAVGMLDLERPLLLEGMRSHSLPVPLLTDILKENYPEVIRQAARRSIEVRRLEFVTNVESGDVYSKTPLLQMSLRNAALQCVIPEYYFTWNAVKLSQFQAEVAAGTVPLAGDETWKSRKARMDGRRVTIFGYESDQGKVFEQELIHPVILATLHHLAAALELHYLKHGGYPAALAELETGLPPGALRDVDGLPFGYSADTGGAHFTLSSKYGNWSTLPADK